MSRVGRPGRTTGIGGAGLAPTDPLAGFRAAVLRRSVPVLGVTVSILVVVAAADGHRLADMEAAFLGVTLAGLALATWVPWENAAESDESPVAWMWSVIAALVLGGLALVPALAVPTRPLFAAVVVMTGLVLTRIRHVIVTVLTLALVAGSSLVAGASTASDAVGPMVMVALASLASAFAGRQLLKSGHESREHLTALDRERRAFQRLYALATTLGSSVSVEQTLPQLLDRLCRYLDCGVGAWLIADERHGVLRLAPPVMVDGVARHVHDAPEVRLGDSAFVSRVLRADRAMTIDADRLKREREGVLGALDVRVAMAAPLVVDGRRIGVLLMGRPASGAFGEPQLTELAAMAGPAALVLGQLIRHREAAELADRLREVAEMKTDFVSVVSHELRTPLTSIRGALDTLVRPELMGEHPLATELVDSARRQTGRLERLISDLLVASRVDRGDLRSTLMPVSITELFDEVLPTIDSDLIVTDLDPGLHAFADPDQLGQVLRNLVENAIKYGGGSPIEVTARREPFGVSLTVADHGPGIAPADRDRVFERFTQLERPDSRSQEGSGLGLAIVNALVDAMGGQVRLAETDGGGATFRVLFRAPSLDGIQPTRAMPVRT